VLWIGTTLNCLMERFVLAFKCYEGCAQEERAVRKMVQDALNAERAHSRRLQARVEATEAAAGSAVAAAPRLSKEGEAVIQGGKQEPRYA
jgi:hypothetical protein